MVAAAAKGQWAQGAGRCAAGRAYEDGEAAEQQHVAHARQRGEDGLDEDGHAGDALERAQRAQRAEGAQHRVGAHRGEEHRQPRDDDHHKVQLAPRIA